MGNKVGLSFSCASTVFPDVCRLQPPLPLTHQRLGSVWPNLPPSATCACPRRCCVRASSLVSRPLNGVGRLLGWRTSTICQKQTLALDDFTLDPTDPSISPSLHLSLATRNVLSFPTCSRHKEGTGLASSPWNALHTICSHARAQHCHDAESCFLLSLAGFLMRQSSIRRDPFPTSLCLVIRVLCQSKMPVGIVVCQRRPPEPPYSCKRYRPGGPPGPNSPRFGTTSQSSADTGKPSVSSCLRDFKTGNGQ